MTDSMMSALLAIGREAVVLVLLISAPPLATALALGLLMGLFQAATQIQDQTLSVVPRLAAVLAVLAVAGPWIGWHLARFATACFERLPSLVP